jgi:hypothetical protein
MKKIFILLTAFVTFQSFSQLYVSSNSYVYNKGTVVFVNQGINLQTDGNVFLRNEGQLLQGTAAISTNQGEGEVSVFQEGTSDNYDYNYWSSPVGNASSSIGNEPFGIAMLNKPVSLTSSTPAVILPMNNQNGIANPLSISQRWIYKFLSSSTYSQWFQVGSAATILAGEGFTMKGTSGTDVTDIESDGVLNNPGGNGAQRYDFRGKPNDGNISVSVDTGKFTLTGNPYPSALHVNEFLLDISNAACTGIAYYWEQDKSVNSHAILAYRGGYGTYSPMGGILPTDFGIYVPAYFNSYNIDGTLNTAGLTTALAIQRKYAPVGQGFMVKGASNGAILLKNSHREYYKESELYSQFERSANSSTSSSPSDGMNSLSYLRLNTIIDNANTKQLALAFATQATDGVDRGIDALSPVSNDLPDDVYFFLNNDKYVIQGIRFDITKRIPIGIKATDNTNFKFYIPETVNFDENQMVYLYDAQDGMYHDVKNSTFEISLSTGIYNNRFELTFQGNQLENSGNIKNDFVIVQNNTTEMLTVSNPNLLNVRSVTLFDLTGKQIFEKEKLVTQEIYQFSTNGLSEAVYLVELLTADNRKIVQKIIISTTRN